MSPRATGIGKLLVLNSSNKIETWGRVNSAERLRPFKVSVKDRAIRGPGAITGRSFLHDLCLGRRQSFTEK